VTALPTRQNAGTGAEAVTGMLAAAYREAEAFSLTVTGHLPVPAGRRYSVAAS